MNGFYAYTYQVAHTDKRASYYVFSFHIISTSDALELRNTFHKKIGNWSRWFLDSQISERRTVAETHTHPQQRLLILYYSVIMHVVCAGANCFKATCSPCSRRDVLFVSVISHYLYISYC